jgi:hypothetical protein
LRLAEVRFGHLLFAMSLAIPLAMSGPAALAATTSRPR